MRFDLTDLRLFANVHAAGTITGGAALSHMTLASASERVRAMEDSLGTPLLRRVPRGVQRLALAETGAARQLVLCLREDEALGPAAQLFVDHLLAARRVTAPERTRGAAAHP